MVLSAWLFIVTALLHVADRQSLIFCGYNLENYLKMERSVKGSKQPDAPKPEKQIAAVVRFLTEIKPDILGVCEIGAEDDLKDLQARLKAAGLDLPNHEYCHGGDPTRRLGLLTRFPIVQRNSRTDLKYRIGDQIFPVKRGFLDCTIEPRKGFSLHCVGVHLKSKLPVPEADEALMRRNEAHLLRKHVDGIFNDDPDTKLLVYGDFNEQKNQAAMMEVAGVRAAPTGLHDLWLADSRKEHWTHYWHTADLYSRLDYIFVSRALSPYADKRESRIFDPPDYYDGSDHRPVIAKIWLTKK